MSEVKLYKLLELIIKAAEKADSESLGKLNEEFSAEYDKIFADIHYHSEDTRPLHYDRCRNSADSLSRINSKHELYNKLLKDMRCHFQAIKKPEH